MTKKLIAIFTLSFILAGQSYAYACMEACDQRSNPDSNISQVENSEGHDCHAGSNKKQPVKPTANDRCPMTICAVSTTEKPVLTTQVQEKDSIKKIIIRGETVVPDVQIDHKVPLLAYINKPLPQKIRLHLRLRRLLN